ncbi:hypothetical protein K469DRAFT_707100, partial [Zopfia rhizophila CBS 207.26]
MDLLPYSFFSASPSIHTVALFKFGQLSVKRARQHSKTRLFYMENSKELSDLGLGNKKLLEAEEREASLKKMSLETIAPSCTTKQDRPPTPPSVVTAGIPKLPEDSYFEPTIEKSARDHSSLATRSATCGNCGLVLNGIYSVGNLARHQKSQKCASSQRGKIHTCRQCLEKFQRSDGLLAHKRRKHGEPQAKPKKRDMAGLPPRFESTVNTKQGRSLATRYRPLAPKTDMKDSPGFKSKVNTEQDRSLATRSRLPASERTSIVEGG